jgi:hypothetical protein
METKVVVNKVFGEQNEYISIAMDDWSDKDGPGIEGIIKLHDGSNVCYFYYSATDDEQYQKSLDLLAGLQDNINVAYRELQLAYLDAKIRSSDAKEDYEESLKEIFEEAKED